MLKELFIHKISKIICAMLCSVFVFSAFSVCAFSIDIDGKHNSAEWNGGTSYRLINGSSNSGIDFAAVTSLIDSKENALYLCFMYTDSNLETDNPLTGVSLNVDGFGSIELTVSNSPFYIDTESHCVDGAIFADKNEGATCEIRIGFKFGLPKEIDCSVQFIDSNGALSNSCSFNVINEYYVETTAVIISEESNNSNGVQQPVYTYDNKPDKQTAYNYKKKTTTQKRTTQFHIQTSPPYSYIRKTKPPKTTKRITETTEKKTKAPKKQVTKVYYYEKEVILSQVYISEPATKATTVLKTENHSNIAHATTDNQSTDTDTTTGMNSSFSLSKGTTYKVIICSSCAVAFGLIAAAATRNVKKNNDGNNNENDSSESQ